MPDLVPVQIGDATLYHADCIEVMPQLGVSFDAVVTDPPYGIGRLAKQASRLCEGMPEYATGATWDTTADVAWIVELDVPTIIWGGNYFGLPATRAPLVWDKDNAGRDFADIELAWTNLDMVARRIRHRPMNMDGGKVHPTQKPVRVMEWCLSFLPDARCIADPFMGSGTTGVACARMGKRFLGIELERRYFDIACERIEAAYAQGRLFDESTA